MFLIIFITPSDLTFNAKYATKNSKPGGAFPPASPPIIQHSKGACMGAVKQLLIERQELLEEEAKSQPWYGYPSDEAYWAQFYYEDSQRLETQVKKLTAENTILNMIISGQQATPFA